MRRCLVRSLFLLNILLQCGQWCGLYVEWVHMCAFRLLAREKFLLHTKQLCLDVCGGSCEPLGSISDFCAFDLDVTFFIVGSV